MAIAGESLVERSSADWPSQRSPTRAEIAHQPIFQETEKQGIRGSHISLKNKAIAGIEFAWIFCV
jgi:hypothetical protein